MTLLPYKDESARKRDQVVKMFDSISHRYDFLNHLLSFGIDRYWRKRAIAFLKPYQPKLMLDVATGTGDFAIQALQLNPTKIIGVDISQGMLDMGRRKVTKKKLGNKIELQYGDSENLPFTENTFDAVTVTFGVRNFENIQRGLIEIERVLKPNGTLMILEFSKPQVFPFKHVYSFYFSQILPRVGSWVSNNKTAYNYLHDSVSCFPYGQKFLDILREAGFTDVNEKRLTFGISSIYTARKRNGN
jgi:demethylmenaquinone methyltransferase / 2-methoxy-6-polyprenyl-1,4-benzoquinol methylase